jgi:hypothetical protein
MFYKITKNALPLVGLAKILLQGYLLESAIALK